MRGDLLGLHPYVAAPMRLYAAPIRPVRDNPNPFGRFDFFDVDGTLSIADVQTHSR
jgi:hypothetical protein